MRVLLLGNETPACEAVRGFLVGVGEEVRLWTLQATGDLLRDYLPDIALSYSFRWILPEEVFTFPRLGTVNAHISYLPWNRGADPNFWSHAEGTPKGVSLHRIDKGIDTGTLIAREPVSFDEDDTLRTSYEKLHARMRALLEAWWPVIRAGQAPAMPPQPGGTFHLRKDLDPFRHVLARRGWDTPVREVAALALVHDTIHGDRRRNDR